jgi:protein TonB
VERVSQYHPSSPESKIHSAVFATSSNPSARPIRSLAAAVLLHAMLLAAILIHRKSWIAPSKLPGDEHGTRIRLTYTPGRAAPQAVAATPKPPQPTHATIVPLLASQPRPTPPAPVSTTPGTAKSDAPQGTDALGSGNVTVALATFFPRPTPDLSQLPRHTRGDVIVDVVIDETGKITETKVAQSLGQSVDNTVLAIIQTWIFKPATRDGHPVASEQELLFHYEA